MIPKRIHYCWFGRNEKPYYFYTWGYTKVMRPIIIGLLPNFLYDKLHKWNLRGKK